MLKGEGCLEEGEVTLNKVKGKKLIYGPGKEFRRKIDLIKVQKSKKK